MGIHRRHAILDQAESHWHTDVPIRVPCVIPGRRNIEGRRFGAFDRRMRKKIAKLAHQFLGTINVKVDLFRGNFFNLTLAVYSQHQISYSAYPRIAGSLWINGLYSILVTGMITGLPAPINEGRAADSDDIMLIINRRCGDAQKHRFVLKRSHGLIETKLPARHLFINQFTNDLRHRDTRVKTVGTYRPVGKHVYPAIQQHAGFNYRVIWIGTGQGCACQQRQQYS